MQNALSKLVEVIIIIEIKNEWHIVRKNAGTLLWSSLEAVLWKRFGAWVVM